MVETGRGGLEDDMLMTTWENVDDMNGNDEDAHDFGKLPYGNEINSRSSSFHQGLIKHLLW